MLLHLGKALSIFILASTFTSLTVLWLMAVVVKMPIIVPVVHQQPDSQLQATQLQLPVAPAPTTVAKLH